MKPTKLYLLAVAFAVVACGQDKERSEEGSLAETHPKLEKQLERRSVAEPITEGRNPELYQRYQITVEEYQKSGKYDVGNIYRGRLAPLDEKSHTEAGMYRTTLREGMKKGVNFAGKYTVVTVGCGTACQRHFVVDRETGKVLDMIQSSLGAQYSPNSRLFIINPPDTSVNYKDCAYCAPEAYVFENDKFRKVEAK